MQRSARLVLLLLHFHPLPPFPLPGSFTAPWGSLLQSREQYCLAWESKYLMELGNTLDSLLNGLVNMVAQEALKYTVLSGEYPEERFGEGGCCQ